MAIFSHIKLHFRLFYTTLEKFESGVFTLKTRQMLFDHATPKEYENATSIPHCGVVFGANRQGNHVIIMM